MDTINNTPLLLIVDDSRMSRMLIRAIVVDTRPNWRIMEAANGDEAIALADENLPDFVTMDVNMPGISGLEAAGRIRIRHPDTRIAMCTANIQESTREAAKRAGLEFVAKPITAQSVASAIAFFEA
jgi:CheY-like chemotaxis protein